MTHNDSNHDPRYLQGVEEEETGNFECALDLYSQAITGEPKNERYLVARGMLLSEKLDRPGDAIKDFKRALRYTDSRSGDIHLHLSLSYSAKGDPETAYSHARSAIEICNSDPIAIFCAGKSIMSLGDFIKARDYFEKLVSIEPSKSVSWASLGQLNLREKRFSEAISCYQKAFEIEQTPRFLISIGRAQIRLGEYTTAVATLRQAQQMKLSPTDEELVVKYLSWVTSQDTKDSQA